MKKHIFWTTKYYYELPTWSSYNQYLYKKVFKKRTIEETNINIKVQELKKSRETYGYIFHFWLYT
jgi:hypothetical protein